MAVGTNVFLISVRNLWRGKVEGGGEGCVCVRAVM